MPKRRDYGEGGITRRKDGRYQWTFYDEEGKRHFGYGKKGGTRNECLQLLKAAKVKAERGELIPVEKLTVKEYMTEWLTQTKKLKDRANTYQMRTNVVNKRIIPALGNIRLQALTSRHIQKQWIVPMTEENLKSSTVVKYATVLHTALKDACGQGLIVANPSDAVTLPVVKEVDEQNMLDMVQAQQLLEQLKDHWIVPIITLALATALRKAELLSLRWSDIDLKQATLIVRHNVAYIVGQGYVEGPPKTKSSCRKIDIAGFAIDALTIHRKVQLEHRLAIGSSWQDKDLVFAGEHGGFRCFTSLDYVLHRALLRAGLPKICFHDLRHSAVSILISLGVHPKVIQEICGHSSIATTMNIYGRLFPGMQTEAMTKMNGAFEKARTKEA
jgi:integrase